MKKRFAVMLLLTAVGVLGSATTASAAPLKLDNKDIAPKQCDGQGTKQLVNVHYKLINDYDSGFAGNAWANDSIDRQLRIWSQSDGSYCVQVADHGKFVTFAGASPSGASTVGNGVKGELDGGYITSDIVGTFAATRPTKGDLGTFDLQCTDAYNCPGARPSWLDYFSTVSSSNDFAQWGWIYHAGKNGTWLNQDDVAAADSGDITS